MKQAVPQRLVLFQEITVRWHKASRGAPGAVARNRVPEVLALPTDPPSTSWPARFQATAPRVLPAVDSTDNRAADIFLCLVRYSEGNQFQAPGFQYWISLRSRLPEPSTLQFPYWNVPVLTLTGMQDKLQVEFAWGGWVKGGVGAPPRHYRHNHEHVTLASGEWMQVRYNGRHVYGEGGSWYYEKHVLNIGLAEALVPTMFVAGPPDYQITDFADLH